MSIIGRNRQPFTLKQKISTVGVCLLSIHLIGCAGAARKPLSLRAAYSPPPQALIGPPVTIAAAGDIACDPSDRHFNGGRGTENSCQMRATSDVILRIHPSAVLALGDTQYEHGRLSEFLMSYDPTWGRFKNITYPAIGNHEYWTANAAGYFAYFGARAGPLGKAYYSYEISSWHLIALNSDCAHVGGCGFGSPQERWLQNDLQNHVGQCILAYWHHARFSSGLHGSNRAYLPFWKDLYQAGADLVLAGHDHDYEAFAPQDPKGHFDSKRGIREFVVGTGGKSHFKSYRFLPLRRYHDQNSELENSNTFGVLRLELYGNGFAWRFEPIDGTFSDSGTGLCHAAAQ